MLSESTISAARQAAWEKLPDAERVDKNHARAAEFALDLKADSFQSIDVFLNAVLAISALRQFMRSSIWIVSTPLKKT